MPESDHTTIVTYADDTTILSSNNHADVASMNLQAHLHLLEDWLPRWRIKANEKKSTHITFTLRIGSCTPVTLNGRQLLQKEVIKYLGLHLDRGLTWRTDIFTKRNQLGLKLRQMYWILARTSKLSIENKLLLYQMILKAIWTYAISL
ncbi:hypothetical protein ILUMI_21016 [Ignelater luminosus]|uniref:Reverse transcriptase domain-containing protein n=1 Tax=Ignelater luminosus TaxID=2038154 RepID=A0A8K0CCY6_IGNLU|nr:hypothetical protein ILUMI_21016 [Ignelater luminosus]